MKAATIYNPQGNHNTIAYPNGATKQEIAHKFLDLLLTATIGTGLAAILLFLITLA